MHFLARCKTVSLANSIEQHYVRKCDSLLHIKFTTRKFDMQQANILIYHIKTHDSIIAQEIKFWEFMSESNLAQVTN